MSEGIFKADRHKESGLLVAAFPAATSEEVIRCRDCRNLARRGLLHQPAMAG